MRKVLPILALATGLTVTATTADAAGRWGEDLRFVANTGNPGSDGPMALCHIVDFMDILFIPVYTIHEGYALSDSECSGDTYREVTPENFALLQASGMVPADLPIEPAVGLGKLAWGHAWLILGALGLLKMGAMALRSGKRRKAGTPDPLAIHSLVAMSQVAIADGRIGDAEIRQIANIITRLTGQAHSPAKIKDMLSKLNPTSEDLAQVGQDLSEPDRQIVLEAALNIAVADGEMHPNEYIVVSELAHRMRIGAEQFRDAMARISAHLKTVQPT